VRSQYTISLICENTGWNYAYLKQFIPVPLKPANWDEMSYQEQRDRREKGQLIFSVSVYNNFIIYICGEMHRYSGLLGEVTALQRQIIDLSALVVELRSQFNLYSDLITLKMLARKAGMNAGSLRNKIEKLTDEQGREYGLLEHEGMRLKMIKSARGEWVCNRLDFLNQLKKAGLPRIRFWL